MSLPPGTPTWQRVPAGTRVASVCVSRSVSYVPLYVLE